MWHILVHQTGMAEADVVGRQKVSGKDFHSQDIINFRQDKADHLGVPVAEILQASYEDNPADYAGAPLNMFKATLASGGITALVPPPLVELGSDKPEIIANGTDQAAVTVSVSGVDPLPASIEVDVNGLVETVSLSNGSGALDPITAESPCTIEVSVGDPETYWDAHGIQIGAV